MASPHALPSGSSKPSAEPFADQEREVLRLTVSGVSNQDIARSLAIVTGTVKRHIQHIFERFGAKNRTQALLRAQTLGLN